MIIPRDTTDEVNIDLPLAARSNSTITGFLGSIAEDAESDERPTHLNANYRNARSTVLRRSTRCVFGIVIVNQVQGYLDRLQIIGMQLSAM